MIFTAPSREEKLTFQVVLLTILVSHATTGFAADFSWEGKGTGANLNDWLAKQNWINNAVPGAADIAVFATVPSGNSVLPEVNATASIQGIRYDSAAAAFTVGGIGTLTLGANGITNNSTTAQIYNLSLILSAAQVWNANAGGLSFGGALNLQANPLTISGTQPVTHSGSISGTGSLVKSGTGTVTLSGASSFSGGTTINGGRVVVNNVSGSGTGSGSVSINSSGTLGGTGTISGAVTNNPGGTLSAGSSVGQLNTGTEVWSGGSKILWEINDVDAGAGTGWDLLNIIGGLNITATSGNKVYLDLHSLTLANSPGPVNNFDSSQNYIWPIARTTAGISFLPAENEATVFELLLGQFSNALNGGVFNVSLSNGGNDLDVTYTPAAVPEPGVWVLLSSGVLCLAFLHICRRR